MSNNSSTVSAELKKSLENFQYFVNGISVILLLSCAGIATITYVFISSPYPYLTTSKTTFLPANSIFPSVVAFFTTYYFWITDETLVQPFRNAAFETRDNLAHDNNNKLFVNTSNPDKNEFAGVLFDSETSKDSINFNKKIGLKETRISNSYEANSSILMIHKEYEDEDHE